jgi:very-short-patch-repair endonuclease
MKGVIPFSKGKNLPAKHKQNIIKANRKSFINKYKIMGIDKSLLRKLYLDKDLTIQNISDIFRLPFHTIRSLLMTYNIQRKKTCVTQKKLWSNTNFRNKQVKILRESSHIRPTRPEKIVNQICKLNALPFNYVGDGSFVIEGFNPDFVNKKDKKIIEVNGDYWHSLQENKERDIKKKITLTKLGYKILFLKELQIYKNPQKIVEKLVNLHRT